MVVEMLREAGRFRGEGRGLGTLAHSGEDVALSGVAQRRGSLDGKPRKRRSPAEGLSEGRLQRTGDADETQPYPTSGNREPDENLRI